MCPVQSAGIEFAGKGLGRAKPQSYQTTWQMRFLGETDALSTMLAEAGLFETQSLFSYVFMGKHLLRASHTTLAMWRTYSISFN